ncbi:MAG: hypothetical protein A2Y56_12015 [Candidatus Aminicenantes bacterium RBG_13_63_10]|nr:MAG: hypothetical protein A2Y56_12015 [Candidatus Aminicenantes bacterium RBG_13_63_10]
MSPAPRNVPSNILSYAVFFVLSGGIAYFLLLLFESRSFTIFDHRFRPGLLLLAAVWAGTFIGLSVLGRVASRRAWDKDMPLDLGRRFMPKLAVFSPLAFFLLTPLLAGRYLTRDDLLLRLLTLAGLVALAVLFLGLARKTEHNPEWRSLLRRLEDRIARLPRRKKMVVLFLLAFLAYNAVTLVLVMEGITFSGDEPYYLLTAHSLFADGDINLADNYRRQDYFQFYEKDKNPRLKLGVYGRRGKDPDTVYPINLPGISVLMLPFYALSRLARGALRVFLLKSSLSVWAALLGVQIYLLAKQTWNRERLALVLWALAVFTPPVLFYAVHLYPELPIAFLSVFIYRKVTSRNRLAPGHLLLFGLLLALFPWFGLKYNFIFWPLLLVAAYSLLRQHGTRHRVLLFLLPALAGQVLFAVFTHALYGTYSPFSIYEGVMSAEQARALKGAVLDYPLRWRAESFLNYFLDQRDGLLLYAPLYFFMFLGLVEALRKAGREAAGFLLISLPFLLNYAFFTHRQGHSPQGRILAPLSWMALMLVGHFLANNRKRLFLFGFRLAALVSLALAVLLLLHPSFLYQPTTHEVSSRPGDLFIYLGNMRVLLPTYLPSFIKTDNSRYLPNYIWLALIAAFVLLYIFLRPHTDLPRLFRPAVTTALLAAGFFLWVLHPRPGPYPVRSVPYTSRESLGYFLFPVGKGVVMKPGGEMYLHLEKTYDFLFTSRRPLESLKLVFGSEKGEHECRVRFFDLPLFEGRTSFGKREVEIPSPAFVPFKRHSLSFVRLEIAQLSKENMLLDPFYFKVVPRFR